MKNTYLLYLLFLLLSCSKGSEKEKDPEAPVVTLNTPTSNQVFSAGQTINISGTVTDNKYIDKIVIYITNQANGQEYAQVHFHPGTNSYDYTYPYTAQAGISYKIEVEADDPSANSAKRSVLVSCN